MELTLLRSNSGKDATKTYEFKESWIETESYPLIKTCEGLKVPVRSLKDVQKEVSYYEKRRYFLVSGGLVDGVNLSSFRRLKSDDNKTGDSLTLEDRETNLLVLDVDGYKDDLNGNLLKDRAENFIQKALPDEFKNIDYILKPSASYGLTTNDLKCHIYFWSKDAVNNQEMFKWIRYYGKKNDLKEILDHKVMNTNQPIYIQKRKCIVASDPFNENYINYIDKGCCELVFGFEYETQTSDIESDSFDSPEQSIQEMIGTIVLGSSPLHETMNNFIYGRVKDGYTEKHIVKELKGFAASWDLSDNRLNQRYKEIERYVAEAMIKFSPLESAEWKDSGNNENGDGVFTDYPNQGGVMEELIRSCMRWQMFPNRELAVVSAHALISTLGGRVYTLESGSGIVLTALVTAPSTSGKSTIKSFFKWALRFGMNDVSGQLLGAQHYTSPKNLVEDLLGTGTKLSVRTESGQSDKSTAGDMPRVMVYELELATESGRDGYVSSGAQNEKIPALYSPAMTTIRESVAKIQSEADKLNATSIGGTAGRRSHIIVRTHKRHWNRNRLKALPTHLKDMLKSIYGKTIQGYRKDVTKPVPHDKWIEIQYEDVNYLYDKFDEWVDIYNPLAKKHLHFEATFYGRLQQRVPAHAARLAICENPDQPVITNKQIDIAEQSLLSELNAFRGQQESGELDDPWTRLINRIVDIFKGDMTKKKTLKQKSSVKMLRAGCCKVTSLKAMLSTAEEYKDLKSKDNFERLLISKLDMAGIELLSKEESESKYKTGAKILRRVR